MAETPLAAHLPLAGLKVIEISTSVAAPFAAWILATLGADVIKVERKGSGDDARQWGKIFPDGSSSTYHALNRDKRGVTVDLKDPADRAWLEELCVGADIVLQNMRPGTVDRYGLGAQHLRRLNPKLIYCNLWAFGFKGPLKDRPGYDPLMQAYGGLMSVTGEEGRPPIRVGTSIIDMGSGLWCVVGILSAINHRHHTGEGCVIDASLYETSLAWMNVHVSAVQVDGLNPKKEGSGARGMAPYQAYACSDGHLVIAAPNDSLFKRLSEVLGHPEWPSDPRFDTNQKRASRDFNDTKGILLGSTHTAIQANCARMIKVIGCRQTRSSINPRSNDDRSRKRTVRPTMMGSVGRAMPIPPISNSSKLMDRGVANTRKINAPMTATTP